jgi:hypothetical protein
MAVPVGSHFGSHNLNGREDPETQLTNVRSRTLSYGTCRGTSLDLGQSPVGTPTGNVGPGR